MRITSPHTIIPAWYRPALAFRTGILRDLHRLEQGTGLARTLHLVRTRCRRLQALLELLGEADRARAIRRAVAKLSKLRAFHVFRQSLRERRAPRRDRQEVARRIQKEEERLRRKGVFKKIEKTIWQVGLPTAIPPDHSLSVRIPEVRQQHVTRLGELMEGSAQKPRRKLLHALRLHIKQIRYQTEWLPGEEVEKAALTKRLKRIQALLGQYEDLAEFREWADAWDLTVSGRIKDDWKRARKRARLVPEQLAWLPTELAGGRAWRDREELGRPRLLG
jgi:CHAD domain-containing protein